MTHYTRAQWGARQYRTGGNAVTNGPKGVDFHYNGPKMAIPVEVPCGCAARVRSIQNFHMDVKGWKDIAYDVVACPHGNTFQGRLDTPNGTGANGTDSANRNYMAVMGLFGDGDPVGDDLKRAMLAGRELCRKAGAGAEIHPHSDHEATSCPGNIMRAWIAAGAPAPDGGTPVTDPTRPRLGDRGDLVREVQTLLVAHGYTQVDVDGVFGPITDECVRHFQSTRGLDVDGIVGPATMAQLKILPPPPVVTPPPPPATTLDDVLAAVTSLTSRLEGKGVI